jgi:CRISPR-associated endonuclease Cas1
MAASATVSQLRQFRNLLTPRHGVVTLFGYGIKVYVDRGHLTLEDGIGIDRHKARFPRVGHGLRRLVVIGSDGMVSLAALRWLADQDAAFVMLDRDGSVLATTGPVRPSDARLRRAQVLAHHSDVALQIVRELIAEKLEAQEKLARDGLNDGEATNAIARVRESVTIAESIERVRLLEARAAHFYWNAWRKVAITFPKRDLHRIPEHWRTFGTRVSPLTGSPRLAANPVNAMLNYLYAVLEAETRLAVAALGLDPGLGVLHVDSQARDSLACDVMEPIRPQVDAYVLEWVTHETLRRDWFFEQRDGSCRLMGSFAVRLSETAPTWATTVAPVAERIARILWSTTTKGSRKELPPTRLTQDHRRAARGLPGGTHQVSPPRPESFCRDCGAEIGRGRTRCATCSNVLNTAGLIKAAGQGRIAAQSDEAQVRRADTQRRHEAARADWQPSDDPAWLSKEFYRREIQPRLKRITLSFLTSTLGISIPYAVDIRSGRRVPHPRHWLRLAQLVAVTGAETILE